MSDSAETRAIKSFLNMKTLIIAVVSIFIAGVVSVVTVTTYLDDRANDKYYNKGAGQVLELKVQTMEENLKEQSGKMDTLQQQQNQLLMGIGKIEGKIDALPQRR